MVINRESYTEGGVYYETNYLSLGFDEIRVIIRALEYYTDKRKLDFKERMLAGDMAREIKNSPIINIED